MTPRSRRLIAAFLLPALLVGPNVALAATMPLANRVKDPIPFACQALMLPLREFTPSAVPTSAIEQRAGEAALARVPKLHRRLIPRPLYDPTHRNTLKQGYEGPTLFYPDDAANLDRVYANLLSGRIYAGISAHELRRIHNKFHTQFGAPVELPISPSGASDRKSQTVYTLRRSLTATRPEIVAYDERLDPDVSAVTFLPAGQMQGLKWEIVARQARGLHALESPENLFRADFVQAIRRHLSKNHSGDPYQKLNRFAKVIFEFRPQAFPEETYFWRDSEGRQILTVVFDEELLRRGNFMQLKSALSEAGRWVAGPDDSQAAVTTDVIIAFLVEFGIEAFVSTFGSWVITGTRTMKQWFEATNFSAHRYLGKNGVWQEPGRIVYETPTFYREIFAMVTELLKDLDRRHPHVRELSFNELRKLMPWPLYEGQLGPVRVKNVYRLGAAA